MASVPPPAACLRCSTPLIPGAGFCGTCGTPAGASGVPPLPPPLPPRPVGLGAQPVAMPMDAGQAMQAAAVAIGSLKGEVVNQGPTQLAFKIGNAMSGRHTGMIEVLPEGPQRSTLNVALKPDYGSLLPGIGVCVVMFGFMYFVQQSQLNDPSNYTMNGYQGAYMSPGLVFFAMLVGLGLSAYLLGTSTLEKRRKALVAALQAQGGMPPVAAGPQSYPGQPYAAQSYPGQPYTGQPMPVPPVNAAVPPQPQAVPPPATPFEQLSRLAELRDKGAITAADYEQAKAAIMAKIG